MVQLIILWACKYHTMDDNEEHKKVEVIFEPNERNSATFIIHDEDHTMGNSIRYILMKDKNVEFAGYSIPHPSDNHLNFRLQTFEGKDAISTFTQALNNLEDITQHIMNVFDSSVTKFEKDSNKMKQ